MCEREREGERERGGERDREWWLVALRVWVAMLCSYTCRVGIGIIHNISCSYDEVRQFRRLAAVQSSK